MYVDICFILLEPKIEILSLKKNPVKRYIINKWLIDANARINNKTAKNC